MQRISVVVVATTMLAASAAWAQTGAPAPDKAPADIGACAKKSFGRDGTIRDIALHSVDREGNAKIIKLRMFTKPGRDGSSRINLRVTAPAGLKGTGYLVLENTVSDSVYLYVPLFQSVVEVKGSEMTQPLWGTGVSYAELKHIQGLLERTGSKRLPDSVIGGRPVFVLEAGADMETDGYRRIVSQLDQQTCVLLKADFYGKGDTPAKTLEADPASLRVAGALAFASSVKVRNLKDGMQTQLTLSDPTIVPNLNELFFDQTNFFSMEE